jgi:hypothetical protein
MIYDYTIDQFESDFEEASSYDQKNEVILRSLDLLDIRDIEVREVILKLRYELKDYQLEMNKEEDVSCNRDIESGSCELYKCIKSIDNLLEGYNYYVKIDDVKSKYTEALGDIPESIKEYIDSIKPLIWIISDNGIGTLKTKNVFTENFSDYFQK